MSFIDTVHDDFIGFGTSAIDTKAGFLVGRPYGGLAFLWRKKLGNSVSMRNYDDTRLLGMFISGFGVQALLLNAYMPAADPDNHDLFQDYLGSIGAIVGECGCGHVIIPGDWNARSDRVEFQWLVDFCSDSDLVLTDINRLPDDSFSYVSESHHTVSWIDHVIMSTAANGACTDMRILYDFIVSDHRPLFLFLLILGIYLMWRI